MEREIKFRLWNGYSMVDPYKTTPLALDKDLNIDGLFIPFHKDYTLMQFTGFKDKNGNDVYEGDILENGRKVLWIKGAFWIKQINGDGNYPLCFQSTETLPESVIGNIYENQELLNPSL